jgi:hypothetical protein
MHVHLLPAGDLPGFDALYPIDYMNMKNLPAVLQVPDGEKRRRADYIIDTGCSLQQTQQQVVSILQELAGRQGTAAARLLAHGSDGQQQAG